MDKYRYFSIRMTQDEFDELSEISKTERLPKSVIVLRAIKLYKDRNTTNIDFLTQRINQLEEQFNEMVK